MTDLCDVEVIVIKRSLTYLSDVRDQFVPLSSSSFLQEIEEVEIPDLDVVDTKNLQSRFKHCRTFDNN